MLGKVTSQRCYNPEDLRGCTVAPQSCLIRRHSNKVLERYDRIVSKKRDDVTASEWAWLVRHLEDEKFLKRLADRHEPDNITGFKDDDVIKVPFRQLPTREEHDDLDEFRRHIHEVSSN